MDEQGSGLKVFPQQAYTCYVGEMYHTAYRLLLLQPRECESDHHELCVCVCVWPNQHADLNGRQFSPSKAQWSQIGSIINQRGPITQHHHMAACSRRVVALPLEHRKYDSILLLLLLLYHIIPSKDVYKIQARVGQIISD